ncbi:MAG: hypothetical protein ACK5KL_16285 [Dysgonomonas sp.]
MTIQYNEDEKNGFHTNNEGKKIDRYWKNHRITKKEIDQLQIWLDLLKDILNIDIIKSGVSEDKIRETEQRIGTEIPKALKIIYNYIGNDERFLKSKLENLNFLPLDKLYVENNNLAYKIQGKKYAWGIDLGKLRLNYYAKDYGWYWEKDAISFWEQSVIDISCFAINHMQTVMYSRLKGFTDTLSWPSEVAEKRYKDFFTRIPNLEYYGHTIFYNKEHKALAWFRGGQFTQDILIGCDNKEFIDDFVKRFDLDKANYKILNGEKAKKAK